MKCFHSPSSREGFSLVEAVLSIGILSFGFLALAPLLGLGLTTARVARENRLTAQIAAGLIENAKQGTPSTGPSYFDSASNPCSSNQAVYVVQETVSGYDPGTQQSTASGSPLSRVTLRVTPNGGSARIYADVFPTPPSP